MTESDARYRLGPIERRGLIAGWRPGQVLAVAGAGIGAGLLVAWTRAAAGVVAAVVLLLVGLAVATVPVKGRTTEEWLPSLVAFVLQRGRREVLCLELTTDAASGAGVIAAPGGRHVVVLGVEATGISLLDATQRSRRVNGLMAAIGALASEGASVDRMSWTVSAVDEDGARFAADLRRRGAAGHPTAIAAYRTLLDLPGGLGVHRRVDVALRAMSPTRLLEHAETVARALEDAGHRRATVLDEVQIEQRMTERLGPPVVDDDGRRRYSGDLRFDQLTTAVGGTVSWWIARWPSTPVSAELLGTLLLGDAGRAVTIVVEPVAPALALRRATATRTASVADAELRRRGGFLSDRQGERRRAHTQAREDELVDGFSSLRFAGYISVRASDPAELAALVTATELAAAQSQLDLRRLDGDHLRGLVATLPVCEGLS